VKGKEEGRRKKEEGRRKKEEGRREDEAKISSPVCTEVPEISDLSRP
jgi:hypothetical protein